MQSKKIISLIFILFSLFSFSQVKIGQWLDHLSYSNTNSVSKVESKVYVSNGVGLAVFDERDNRIRKLTKIDGLSDVGIKLLRKNDNNNLLLVIYENTNIDVIKPNDEKDEIVNIADIKRKIITGKKVINEVYFSGKLAYIACGFGIVIFDTDKLEIKDTYYIGTVTINYEVHQVTKNDTALFAATSNGVFYGKLNTNLSFYQNWKPLNVGLAPGPYNGIVNYNGTLITNYSERLKSDVSQKDTLYQYTPTGWTKYSINSNYINNENIRLYDYSKYNKLLILDQFGLKEYNSTGSFLNYLTIYGSTPAFIGEVFYENNNNFWVADKKIGLVKSGGAYFAPYNNITLNGPENNLVNDIDIKDGKLIVAPIYLGETFNPQYMGDKPNVYQEEEWKSMRNVIPNTIGDLNAVSIDPNDKNHIAFAAMTFGVVDVKDDQIQGVYSYGNSPLIGLNGGSDLRISGINFDKNSNLWASITLGEKCVAVKKPNNTWTLLDFEQFVVQPYMSKIIFDDFDQAWIILARGYGLMVYKDVNGLSQPNTSNTKLLSTAIGNGHLPSIDIKSMCSDKDGHVWLGTAKGISVVYNPENVFTNNNFDSQQILIEQDGQVQILLENDAITSIAVDGVNRKWIGTESSGVYCLSPDGQQEIFHFTAENSPLYSNYIKDIVTDETTGDVFMATNIGIQSYRTAFIKGFEKFTKVHAYPNPVKPGYTGNVVITGLMDESDVKITDLSGNLVWTAKSQGGQIEWNMSTFSGKKASTGTYMIYCATGEGESYATAKLLIVN
jgi:hypothetical protein